MRAFAILLLLAAATHAEPVAFKGAKIFTATKGTIESGTLVVDGKRILAVGPANEVLIPAGARVVDVTGKVIIPGLVDTHSHLGVYSLPHLAANSDGNEMTGAVQSLVRAQDSLFPMDPGFKRAHAGAITTANVMPGSGNVMGGSTAYIKLRGNTVEEMLIDLEGGPSGMKMANGENPKRSYGRRNQTPATRMAVMALQREIYQKARNYIVKLKNEPDKTERDLALEPVVEILQKKRTVHFHTHRADDIVSALRLAEEFGFEVVLHHVTEAYRVPERIAKAKVRCSLTLLDAPGGKPEAVNLRYENAALAHKAGIEIALNTDDPVTESRLFLRTAALAIRGGLPRDAALAALTIVPARMMHLDKRIGSLEKGKDADFAILSGDPFSAYTQVLQTWIEGDLVFDRTRNSDMRRATGGHHVRTRMPQEGYVPKDAPKATTLPKGNAPANAKTFVVRAAMLHTGKETIEDGVVYVENGRITTVGKFTELRPPGGMPVYAAHHVTPGLIDTHGSAGLTGIFNVPADQDLQEPKDPNQASLRVLDGFNPRERLLRYLLRHGVTLVQVVPGPDHAIAGQAGIFRTDRGTIDEATVRFPSAMVFNIGERVKGGDSGTKTRMGIAALIRQAFVEAARRTAKDEKRDLDREALMPVLERKLPAMFVAHREDDIATALRLAKEFKLDAWLSQATEAFLATDAIAKAGVPVLAAPTTQRAGGLERFNSCFENAGICADAGIPIAMTSSFEGYVPKTRVVLFEAGVAAVNRLGWQRALRSLTIDAAKILGIDKEYGSIEKGKVADLVLFNGDPFEFTSNIVAVYGKGELVYKRD
ncbi:MAG: amidohydrolase family protein [Planctomycetota bacterium]